MKRLYLTVEGQTEQAFAVDVLQPHLAALNVFVIKPRLTGPHGRRGGRIPKGGMFNKFQHSLNDIRRWLKEDKSTDARFSTMVDLYKLPSDFPGHEEAMTLVDPYKQAAKLEKAISEEVNDGRFIPYVQVHEFEALVLANPVRLADWFDGVEKQVKKLISACEPYDSPELIDHGEGTHPKARIKRHIADYHENVDGPLLTLDIGLDKIRAECPHFNDWLTILENLDAEERN